MEDNKDLSIKSLFFGDKEDNNGNYVMLAFYMIPGLGYLFELGNFWRSWFLVLSVSFALGIVMSSVVGFGIKDLLLLILKRVNIDQLISSYKKPERIIRLSIALTFIGLNWVFVYYTPMEYRSGQFKLIVLFTSLYLVYAIWGAWLNIGWKRKSK